MQAEPPANNTESLNPIPKYLKILTGVMIIMFPVGLFIMLSDWGRQFLWTTTLFLGLQAVIMLLVTTKLSSFVSAFSGMIITLMVSFFIEWWGVNTGFPFGYYMYTDVLQPQLFGVPIAITFAWFAVVSSSLVFARHLTEKNVGISVIVISAAFILATDILLEPFASFINNYWSWALNFIPFRNFIAWFGFGVIFSFVLNKLLQWKDDAKNKNFMLIPVIIIFINILNFSILNIAYGYYALTLTGLTVFILIIISVRLIKQREIL